MTRLWRTTIAVVLGSFFIPGTAIAQRGQASIAGQTKDTTGGVLPGVTVEAASPALIEGVRTVVTDANGQYRIVDLRPGTYVVTFSLPGFGTLRREGIELTANFTAPINAELSVGQLAQEVVVSGVAPLVDVQNVLQQRTMTRDVLDNVPTANYYQSFGVLIPGMVVGGVVAAATQDVGGNLGSVSQTLGIHGGRVRDQQIMLDGLYINTAARNDTATMILQTGNVQEISMMIGSNTAEAETGGVRINLIPKDGGDRFSGHLYTNFANSRFQSNNLDDKLRNAGLNAPNRVKLHRDFNPALGGPLRRGKLWFFTTYRNQLNENWVGGSYYNRDPAAWTYVPDLTRQGFLDQRSWDTNVRGTWQASPKNKLSLYFQHNYYCDCHRESSALRPPETSSRRLAANTLYQVSWTSPVTDRVLLEAGGSFVDISDIDDFQPGVTQPPILEQSTGLWYRQRSNGRQSGPNQNLNYRASISYITGAHSFKTGMTWKRESLQEYHSLIGGDVSYRVLNAVPNQVTYFPTPWFLDNQVRPNIGLFVQDQWTIRSLTLSPGVRYDVFHTSDQGVELAPTRWLPARSFSGVDALKWTDLSPRLSAAYDLSGNGKTAVKMSVGRYMLQYGTSRSDGTNIVQASNNVSSRTWTDFNNDRVVDADPFNPLTNGELGPQSNLNFGKQIITLRNDPRMAVGFGNRPYNWELSGGVQHEVMPGLAVNVAYFRRWFGNFIVTDNLAVSPADYDPYCITAPRDPRLPGGGGDQICGLFDQSPATFGRVDNLRTLSGHYGAQREHWNGMDLTVQARQLAGLMLQGGLSTGKTTLDSCDVSPKMDSPSPRFCHTETPFLTQVKFLGTYSLPLEFQVSGAFQSIPGNPITASYVATNALIRPSLGRDLAGGSNATIQLIEPGTMYLDRINQLDMRLTKLFRVGNARIMGMFDVFNLMNANTPIVVNNSYGTTGASWLNPQIILGARVVKFSAQIDF